MFIKSHINSLYVYFFFFSFEAIYTAVIFPLFFFPVGLEITVLIIFSHMVNAVCMCVCVSVYVCVCVCVCVSVCL